MKKILGTNPADLLEKWPNAFKALPEPYQNDSCLLFWEQDGVLWCEPAEGQEEALGSWRAFFETVWHFMQNDKVFEIVPQEIHFAQDHLGRELSGDKICEILSAMLGWKTTVPWHVLERDLRERLNRLKIFL